MEPLRIVQISDTHFGDELKPDKFKRAVKQINALEPELVIVSGDITPGGFTGNSEMPMRHWAILKRSFL